MTIRNQLFLLLVTVFSFSLQGNLKKISNDLYSGKKGDLYLNFERLTSDNKKFWEEYAYHQMTMAKNLKNDVYEKDGESESYQRAVDLYETIGSFSGMITSSNDDVWIAYATPKDESISEDDIEIAVTVNTNKNIPFSTHMGIFRNINKKNSPYKNLAMTLHSFAAQATQAAYDNNKKYMITRPIGIMGTLMRKSLGSFAWTNQEIPTVSIDYKKNSMSVIDPFEEFTFTMPSFFKKPYIMGTYDEDVVDWYNSEVNPIVIVNIDVLADYMKLD